MRRPKILPTFSTEQRALAHDLLATRVAFMMGRKLEEDDWAEVYCRAKGIENEGWSNLDIDVTHGLLGVEHKMMKVNSKGDITDNCGKTLMHPAATRSIRPPPKSTPANDAMRSIFAEYGQLISDRARKIREASGSTGEPDMRTGWLLWQESLRQFLYFEEEMFAPDPDDYRAEWVERQTRGSRKPSTNLWVYEKETGRKRYSVTSEAGAKIQPYFDIPPLMEANLYVFTVIGETLLKANVRVWLTESTHRELCSLLSEPNSETISRVILEEANQLSNLGTLDQAKREKAVALEISQDAYNVLQKMLPGVNDDHSFQLLVQHLRSKRHH
jgi:hypothetical protein